MKQVSINGLDLKFTDEYSVMAVVMLMHATNPLEDIAERQTNHRAGCYAKPSVSGKGLALPLIRTTKMLTAEGMSGNIVYANVYDGNIVQYSLFVTLDNGNTTGEDQYAPYDAAFPFSYNQLKWDHDLTLYRRSYVALPELSIVMMDRSDLVTNQDGTTQKMGMFLFFTPDGEEFGSHYHYGDVQSTDFEKLANRINKGLGQYAINSGLEEVTFIQTDELVQAFSHME